MAWTTWASLPSVVIMTTGTPFAFATLGSCLMNSSPSMMGMLMSHRMMSTRLSFRRFKASAPLAASNTCCSSMPAWRNERSTIFLMTEESSTIRARMLFMTKPTSPLGKTIWPRPVGHDSFATCVRTCCIGQFDAELEHSLDGSRLTAQISGSGFLSQNRQDLFADLLRREGLPDVSARPVGERLHDFGLAAFGGDHDHGRTFRHPAGTEPLEKLQPVHHRHIDVTKHQIDGIVLEQG